MEAPARKLIYKRVLVVVKVKKLELRLCGIRARVRNRLVGIRVKRIGVMPALWCQS